jgi:seryl-tRNA synthetase
MLDIRFVRESPELVKNDLHKRGMLNKIEWVDDVLLYDKEWRKLLTEANRLREKRRITRIQ